MGLQDKLDEYKKSFLEKAPPEKGNVISAEANPDYTQRPEPSEIVEVLKKMG